MINETNIKNYAAVAMAANAGHNAAYADAGAAARAAYTAAYADAGVWLEGLEHTDHPTCICPVIAAYVRRLNDNFDDKDRQRLVAYLPKLVGTVGTKQDELERGYIFAQAAGEVFAYKALLAAGMKDHAEKVAAAFKSRDWEAARAAADAANAAAYAAGAAYAADARAAAAVSAARTAARAAADAARAADYAARAASYAAAYADYAAARAARAAADAARADVDGALMVLDLALAVGPQSPYKGEKS